MRTLLLVAALAAVTGCSPSERTAPPQGNLYDVRLVDFVRAPSGWTAYKATSIREDGKWFEFVEAGTGRTIRTTCPVLVTLPTTIRHEGD